MKLLNRIWLLALPLALVACSSDDGNEAVTPDGGGNGESGGNTSTAVLTSSTPANGATDVDVLTSEITLTFSAEVNFVNGAKASFNGEEYNILSTFTKKVNVMTFALESSLTFDTQYTLTIPEGSFVAKDGGADVPAISISFTTKAKPQTDTENIGPKPVTEGATDEAVNLYQYLLSQYGKKTLSSSMADVSWNFNEADLVNKATGKYPAIASMDYIHIFTQRADWTNKYWVVNYDVDDDVKNWVNNNGIIAACWHWQVTKNETITKPVADDYVYSNTGTFFKPSNMFVEGTWEKKVHDEDLALIVKNIKKLQDAGIAILWRPLHEASGKWFWWGKEGAEVYKKVWIDMFNYFKENGIKNCIWVWTSQTGYADNSSTIDSDYDWYPGDEYVDIVGRDEYKRTLEQSVAEYDALVNLFPNKMIALSECGTVSDLAKQTSAGAMWLYAMPWYDYGKKTLTGHQHADTDWWTATMACENVITRDQLPALK